MSNDTVIVENGVLYLTGKGLMHYCHSDCEQPKLDILALIADFPDVLPSILRVLMQEKRYGGDKNDLLCQVRKNGREIAKTFIDVEEEKIA